MNVLLGDGNGGFGAAQSQLLYSDSAFPYAVTIADVNGDGNNDVVTDNRNGLSVMLGDGTGSLGSAINSGSGSGAGPWSSQLPLGDFNGDGNLDALLIDGAGLSVQQGDGQGSFTATPALNASCSSYTIGDVNGDGKLDVLAMGSNDNTGNRQATVFLGDGAGNFAPPSTSDLGPGAYSPKDPILVDLNGDGLPELVTVDEANDVVLVAANDGNWNASPASIAISDATVTEGDAGTVNAVFTVSLSAASQQTVYVDFATADGTATAGQDYVATSGTLAFAPGQLTQTITISILGDKIKEPDESFYVMLSGGVNAQIGDSQGLGLILNDDKGGGGKGSGGNGGGGGSGKGRKKK